MSLFHPKVVSIEVYLQECRSRIARLSKLTRLTDGTLRAVEVRAALDVSGYGHSYMAAAQEGQQ